MTAQNILEVALNFPTIKLIKLVDPDDAQKLSSATRFLGLVVCKGLAVMCVYPAEGTEQVENPFIDAVEGN